MGKILAMLVAAVACGSPEEPPPVLTADDLKLARVIADLHVAEAAAEKYRDGVRRDSVRAVYLRQIYAIHSVDSAWVAERFQEMAADPVRMDSVYARALQLVSPKVGVQK